MSDIAELKTIRDFVRFAASRFDEEGLYYGHGTDNAWDEAVHLIFPLLHLHHTTYSAALDARLTTSEKNQLMKAFERRIQDRIPVAYLTHEAWFAGLPFYVDERVLIPRSPLAEVIENHFQPWMDPAEVHSILDVCTGSGCIAIACANYFPNASVDAVDISSDALAVAKINIARHEVEQQVQCFHSDLLEKLPPTKYDVIISNPPYVNAAEMAELPQEYRHEPSLGLEAGINGLDVVEKLLKQATQFLAPNGCLIVEVGNSEQALIERFPNVPFTWIDFQRGDGGVFLLTHDELQRYFGQ